MSWSVKVKVPEKVPDWLTEDLLRKEWNAMVEEGVRKKLIRKLPDGSIVGSDPEKWFSGIQTDS